MKISFNTYKNQIYKYGTNIQKSGQLQQQCQLSLPAKADEVCFGRKAKPADNFFTKKINKSKIKPQEVIEKAESVVEKSKQIMKEAYNINLLAEDIFAKSEEIKNLKKLKGYEINDIKAESEKLYKISEEIINTFVDEIQNSINEDEDTVYEDNKTYVFELEKHNQSLARAYFTYSGGKISIIGTVFSGKNGANDAITCTEDNKPKTIKQGLVDFSQVENLSQNYFYLDENSKLKAAALPAYFYTDGNNKLKFVDKENCYTRTEKIFNYDDGVIRNIKKNCEEKQNGDYSLEEEITLYSGEMYSIENGVTFKNGESKTKSTLWFTKGYLASYSKDIHRTKKNEYLAAEEYHFFNNNLKTYKQGIVDNEYGPVYTEKELQYNGEYLSSAIINSENDDNVSKNEKLFEFANGKPLKYSEGVSYTREADFLSKKEVFNFADNELNSFYSNWNRKEKDKDKTVKVDSAFWFKDNKLINADYDVSVEKEGLFSVKNALFFKDDKIVSRKKNYTSEE